MSRIATVAGLAVLAAAGALFAAASSQRPLDRDRLLETLGNADELDIAFSYAPATGLLAFSNDSGTPALSLFDVRRRSRKRLPIEGGWTRRPVLAPDGHFIVYHQLDVVRRSWEHDLSLFDVQTESVRRLRATGDNDFVSRVAFAPDSRSLVYELVHRLGEHQWLDELRRIDLTTFADTRLFMQSEVTARAPAFTADGRSLYFVSGPCLRHIDSNDGRELDRACVDGAVWPSSMPEWPAVHPDGRWVAFPVELHGCTHIAVVDTATHSAHVTDEHECATRPVWIAGATPQLAYIQQRADGSRIPRWRALWRGQLARLRFPATASPTISRRRRTASCWRSWVRPRCRARWCSCRPGWCAGAALHAAVGSGADADRPTTISSLRASPRRSRGSGARLPR